MCFERNNILRNTKSFYIYYRNKVLVERSTPLFFCQYFIWSNDLGFHPVLGVQEFCTRGELDVFSADVHQVLFTLVILGKKIIFYFLISNFRIMCT